jgi:1-acyl-sn-glycerol-3-phosphate acyltransferase
VFLLFFLATPGVFGQSATNALPKLLPPYGQMPPTFWGQHEMAAVAGSFILLALATAVVWRILKPRPRPVLPPAIIAGEALAKCGARSEDGKVLSEVSQTLRCYVGAVFEFPPGELTTAEFCRQLERSEKIAPQLTRAISDFLRACDERKFSPAISSAPLNAAGRALQFVAVIEEEVRRREDACAAKK